MYNRPDLAILQYIRISNQHVLQDISILFLFVSLKKKEWSQKIAQMLTIWLHKHETLSSIPRTHIILFCFSFKSKPSTVHTLTTPKLRRQRQIPQTSQPRLLSELQAHAKALSQRILRLTSGLTAVHMYLTQTSMHINSIEC